MKKWLVTTLTCGLALSAKDAGAQVIINDMQEPATIVSAPQVVEAPAVRQVVPQSQPVPAQAVQPQQVYFVQQAQPAVAPTVQAQPVTVVEDTPLKESRADALRKSRIEIEQETEQRIVEKLESERMKAEKERADKLLKSIEGPPAVAETPAPAPVPVYNTVPAPVAYPQVQQAPVYVEPQAIVAADEIRTTIKEEAAPVEEPTRMFVQALGGFADYSKENVQGAYSAGVSIGAQFPDRLIIEGSFIYSTYDINNPAPATYIGGKFYPPITQMDQFNVTGGLKYQILPGRVRPNVGGLAGYTRRKFIPRQYYFYNDEITSHAFDAGLSTGVDVALSNAFSVGVDFRYLFNLTYRRDVDYVTYGNIESLDYYMVNFGAKLMF